MSYIKEPEGVVLSVEKRKLTNEEKKSISDFITKSKKQSSSKRKTTLKSRVKVSK